MAPVAVVVLASLIARAAPVAYTNCVCAEGLHFSAFHYNSFFTQYMSGKTLCVCYVAASERQETLEQTCSQGRRKQLKGGQAKVNPVALPRFGGMSPQMFYATFAGS